MVSVATGWVQDMRVQKPLSGEGVASGLSWPLGMMVHGQCQGLGGLGARV